MPGVEPRRCCGEAYKVGQTTEPWGLTYLQWLKAQNNGQRLAGEPRTRPYRASTRSPIRRGVAVRTTVPRSDTTKLDGGYDSWVPQSGTVGN